jgi:two-component system OmpR family sensor kinase/two-component system sensor histidine kinase BaeS
VKFNSLWLKLTGSFALLILAVAVTLSFSLQSITVNNFTRLVRNSDLARAVNLAPDLGRGYEQGGWTSVQKIVLTLASNGPQRSMMGWGMMQNRPMRPDAGRHAMGIRLVAVTPDGRVMIDSEDTLTGRDFPTVTSPGTGVPILAAGRSVGFLFVGTMIEPLLTQEDQQFLDSVQWAVIWVSLGAIAVALFLGSFLVRQITAPLGRLAAASNRVAQGDLDVRVVSASHDELGDISLQFNAMLKALQNARDRQKQFIADAAHELRTPVALMQGTLEMMVDGIYPISHEHLVVLHQETLRMGRLVADLQDLSLADSGQLSLALQQESTTLILSLALELFRADAQKQGVELSLVDEAAGNCIVGDRDRLIRVFSNLVANALKYAPAGSEIRVVSRWGAEIPGWVVCVEDQGPGIPPHDAEKVFERFYRIDSSRTRDAGGSGLGLPICREILQAHGGTIQVDKDYRPGTRIRCWIPALSTKAPKEK